MKFFLQILTKNSCYKADRKITPRGVMVHSTGANNPRLSRYVPGNEDIGYNTGGNHWDMEGVGACVHAFIGKLADGSVGVVQTLPWNRRGWHAGKGRRGSANDTHISFEICEDGLQDAGYFEAVYQAAVELTADLCKQYNLDPQKDGVVICHSEGHSRGIASNHADVMHWFPIHGKTMDTFRSDVARSMEGEEEMKQEDWDKMMEDYLARRAKQSASSWATEPTPQHPKGILEEAKAMGFTDGSRPKANATREEVASMILAAIAGDR